MWCKGTSVGIDGGFSLDGIGLTEGVVEVMAVRIKKKRSVIGAVMVNEIPEGDVSDESDSYSIMKRDE